MTDDSLARLEELFQRAADLPPDGREAFLAGACDDEALRARVRDLLARLDHGASLPAPPVELEAAAARVLERPGDVIDRYKLLEVIGEGGFGVVYMAEQLEPVQRRVALKIIKLGMDTKEVVARFEAERQALAIMDHPHIAKVLDGGSTATGRPYFVMELVAGVSITDYCDGNALSTADRLGLFRQVCQAVEHAHQKGVIHRDIKPSNVLVTLADGVPVPKVIDFGIAKAVDQRLTEKTLFTRFQRFVGTPAYMSPEQAEMSNLDIDTRTDIYSLGVLLYELLTGTPPFDTRSLMAAGLAEIQRVIREEPPQRPSVRISTTADVALAARRGQDLAALSRGLRGDLDWIVMKALEKDRRRRYATASEVAADVERHLANEPVLAGPPGTAYRMRKFLARNRAAVTWVAVLLVALLLGIVGTTAGMIEARRQGERAQRAADRARQRHEEARAAQAEEARQRALAEREAETARVVTDFLVDTLAFANPQVALSSEMSVRTLLDRTAASLDGSFAGQPGAEARVRATVGRAYAALGEQETADVHLRRAVDLFEAQGPDPRDAFDHYTALWALTNVAFGIERPDAFAIAAKARDVGLAHLAVRHPDVADALERLLALVEEGAHVPSTGDIEAARELHPEVVALAERSIPPGDPSWTIVGDTFMHAGYSIWYTVHDAETGRYFRTAYEIRRRELPAHHPDVAEALSLLAGALNRSGRALEAESMMRDSLERLRTSYPDGTFPIAWAESMLGENLLQQGRLAEAEPLLLSAHEVIEDVSPNESVFFVVDSLGRLVSLYESWDRNDDAAVYRDRLTRICATSRWVMPWPIQRLVLGPRQAPLRAALDELVPVLGEPVYSATVERRDASGVVEPLEEVLRLRRELLADDHGASAVVARQLVRWADVMEPGTADAVRRSMLEEALALLEPRAEVTPDDLAEAHAHLATMDLAAGDETAALEHGRRAARLLAEAPRYDHWFMASTKVRVGRVLIPLGLLEEAETLLVPSVPIFAAQLGDDHSETRQARRLVIALYEAWGREDEAAAWR